MFTGGLGSYSVTLLVLSFLQVHPKLQRDEITAERNLGTLLMEFLELYGKNFGYDECGISVRGDGHTLANDSVVCLTHASHSCCASKTHTILVRGRS